MTTSVTSSTAASTGYAALSTTSSGTGIDYATLIDAAVAARTTPADRIDTKITANDAKIAAYTELQTLLQAVNDSIDGLRNRSTATGADSNLFDSRAAYLSGSDASDRIGVAVEDGTETGSYSIVVEQLATRHKVGSAKQSSQESALGLSGSFSIGAEGSTAVSIDVEAGDSLEDIADAINAQKATSGVGASIVKVSDTEYQLILTSTETGQEISVTDGDGVLNGLGITDGDGAFASELVPAKDAIIVIDGVEITRSSNTIDDAIEGVTLDLYEADADSTITLEVSNDLSSIKSAVVEFVDAYNALREFVVAQQATNTDGTASDSATLFADSLLRQINQNITNVLNGSVAGPDGSLSFADLGISFASDNSLELDEDVLDAALTDNLDEVKALLGLTMTTSSSDLQLLRYEGGQNELSFTLDIAVDADGTITSASVDGDGSLFEVSGSRIIGKDGTAYEGIVLVYSGDASDSIDVSFSQGLADQLYSVIDNAANGTDGDLATEIDSLEDINSDLQTKSDRIRDNAEDYRSRLTAYYARLEQKAEEAAILLEQIKAASGTDDE